MIKKFIITCSILILLSTTVLASMLMNFSCTKCNYKNEDKLEYGTLHRGCSYAIVYCPKCKKFHTIKIRDESSKRYKDEQVVESVGKEVFFGAERAAYLCPHCGSKAFEYEPSGEEICPVCGEGALKKETVGYKD